MARSDRQLLIAGLAAGLSLILAGVALTISVIVISRPPVYQNVSADLNAAIAGLRRWEWIAPALNVLVALGVITQVALRRPVLVSLEGARRWPEVSKAQIACFGVLAGFVVVLSGSVIAKEVLSLIAERSRPLTDNPSLSGLRNSVGLVSFVFAMLGLLIFTRWWQQREWAGTVLRD